MTRRLPPPPRTAEDIPPRLRALYPRLFDEPHAGLLWTRTPDGWRIRDVAREAAEALRTEGRA